MVELKRLEQEGKLMKEFVQKFRKVAKESSYKRRLLVEEFKKGFGQKLEEKQKRRKEIEKMMRAKAIGSKVEQYRDTTVIDVIALSLAQETRSSTTVGSNNTYFDRES